LPQLLLVRQAVQHELVLALLIVVSRSLFRGVARKVLLFTEQLDVIRSVRRLEIQVGSDLLFIVALYANGERDE
jgi:hypothetical protein